MIFNASKDIHKGYIYRSSFPASKQEDYKEACYVTTGQKNETVILCEWILEDNMKQDMVSLEEKIRFWNTHRKHIKMNVNKIRQTDMNSFSKKFKKGMCSIQTVYLVLFYLLLLSH